jgi:protein disulfide-isomerase A6
MGVQGFPTLKIVKPGSKRGRPVVEDYQGPRSAKGIVDAVVEKIPNHVKKLQDSTIDAWLADASTSAKAILFTEKGTTSALIRALAIDFLGSVSVAQVRSKEAAAVEKFGVTEFPTIVLVPGDGSEPIVYTDEMKKQPLVDLLSTVASPNADPAPAKAKSTKSKDSKKSASASSAFSKASETHKASDLDDELGAKTIVLDEDTPLESPLPVVEDQKSVVLPEISAIPALSTSSELNEVALGTKKGTCILVLLPATQDSVPSEQSAGALGHLAQIADKHLKRKDNTFPFYSVPAENEQASIVRADLGLKDSSHLEIIAINSKRGWWRHFDGSSTSFADIESFIDAIKLGDGKPQKLPENFNGKQAEVTEPEPAEAEPVPEPSADGAEETPEPADESAAEPEPAAKPEVNHNEL